MTSEDISATQADFVKAARNALAAGCDGIEIHAGNGCATPMIGRLKLMARYLFDQFHHSNGMSQCYA